MKWLVQLSGGFDSAAAFLWANKHGEATPVFYEYGQPYWRQEFHAAERLAQMFGTHLHRCDIQLEVRSTTDVKEYVPLRNLVLIAHSISLAAAWDIPAVVVGFKSVHPTLGDPYSFRDAGLDFLNALNWVTSVASEFGAVSPKVVMPLEGWSKLQVVKSVLDFGISPSSLWNCYKDGEEPCGVCHHCTELSDVMRRIRSCETV